MNTHHLPYWLAALYLPQVGPRKFLRWLTHFEDIQAFFTATRDTWRGMGMTAKDIEAVQNPDWQAVEKEMAWAQKEGCHLLAFAGEDYPPSLKEIHDPPLVLFVQGNKEALLKTQLAIVGSRHATPQGVKNAQAFAYQLAEWGLVITSGLALGIDGASHQGALEAGGLTIGVAGTGLHSVYPPSHARLVQAMLAANGAVVSEFPLATPPHPKNFPRRNRIIAGLSVGVLVVEAALKSGSLITARLALEQGREVFAIPGSIHHPLSKGCHYLIREGAKLVEEGADILAELSANLTLDAPRFKRENPAQKQKPPENLPAACWQLLEQIECDITPNDVILLRSGLTTGEVSSILLTLELSGYIRSVPGGYIRIVTNQ